jgi:long-chain fatty acid transport protein
MMKTPFTIDLSHHYTVDEEIIFPDDPGQNVSVSEDDETSEELDIPMSYGMGLAYRFSDRLTLSLDDFRIEWDDFTLRYGDGREISPITGESADEADIEPTLQFRAGTEYLYYSDPYVIPIRGGIFYDPAPADGGFDDFFGFNCGTGFARGRVVFDLAYQYRYGNDVAEFILEEYEFSQDAEEHMVYASIMYHF